MCRSDLKYAGETKLDIFFTTAHCITGRDIAQIEVVAGAYNLTNSIEPTQQRSGISDVFFHSRFNPETLEYDAASLVLSKPFEFGPRVQPALIPEPPFYPSESVVNCTLVGWGSAQSSLSEDESSQLLQKLNMTVVPFAECQLIYQHIKPINRSTMICASHIGEHGFGGGPCKGDAGGPLVCKIPPQNETEVIGIVSWSMIPCADPSFPPVFTNSSIFHDDFLV